MPCEKWKKDYHIVTNIYIVNKHFIFLDNMNTRLNL